MKTTSFFLSFWLVLSVWGQNIFKSTESDFPDIPGLHAGRPDLSRNVLALDSLNIEINYSNELAKQLIWDYDEWGNVILDESREYSQGQLADGRRVVTQYSAYEKPQHKERFYFDNGSWHRDWRQQYYYDAQDRVDSIVREDYNGTDWQLSKKYIYTYNGQLVTEILTQEYSNGQWNDIQKQTFSYDAQEHVTEYITQSYTNGQWVNMHRQTRTYTAAGYEDVITDYTWGNNGWEYESRKTYTYNNLDFPLSIIDQDYDNGQWVNDDKEEFQYDANNDLSADIDYNWDNGAWEPESKLEVNHDTTVTYNQLLLPEKELGIIRPDVSFRHKINDGDIFSYNNTTHTWARVANISMYYSNRQLDVAQQQATYSPELYPNPVEDILYLNTGKEPVEHIKIYSLSGRLWKQADGKALETVNVKDLPAGIYILQAYGKRSRYIGRFVKK